MGMELMRKPNSMHDATARGRARTRLPRGRKGRRELADLGVIASKLVHEIRNPLNTMRVQTSVIARKLARGAPTDHKVANEQLAALQEEIVRLDKLAQAFLAYGRPPDGEPERIHLPDFLARLVELLAPECESRNIKPVLHVGKAGQTATVWMDRSQLEQVLLNLIRNANNAMEDGGVLTLTLRKLGSKSVGIGIHDTGCGIAHDKMATIFDPFYSNRPGGTGLGLPIARQIIEAAGGYIRLESEVNRGSCFEVVLCLAEDGGNVNP